MRTGRQQKERKSMARVVFANPSPNHSGIRHRSGLSPVEAMVSLLRDGERLIVSEFQSGRRALRRFWAEVDQDRRDFALRRAFAAMDDRMLADIGYGPASFDRISG